MLEWRRTHAMPNVTIEGQGNLPARPTLAYLNRADLCIVQELEKAMGGKVAWLVEASCMPSAEVMAYLGQPGTRGILTDMARMSREVLADRVSDLLNQGFHVVLVTGHPTQARGTLADVPPRLLSYLDETPLPVLPIYAGLANDEPENALPTTAPYDHLSLCFLPRQREGKALGARVRGAWMEASAWHLSNHPLLREASLPQLLVTALMRHQDARLIDGVDDSTLTYRNLLALSLMLAVRLREQTKDKRVGIILPPGKLAAVANLACLLAGISPLNVNYMQAKADTARALRQAGVNRFITEERFRLQQPQFAWPRTRDLIFADRELTELGRGPFNFWRTLVRFSKPGYVMQRLHMPAVSPDGEAALLFTSGFETRRKPVPMSHRMLVASLLQLQNRLDMQPGQRVLAALPFYHSLGFVHGLLLPLLFGYDLVTYPSVQPDNRISPTPSNARQAELRLKQSARRLVALVGQYSVRMGAVTLGMANGMLHEESAGEFPQLRYLMVGGAALPETLVQEAWKRHRIHLLSAYSLAEAAPLASLNLPPADGAVEGPDGPCPPTLPAWRAGSVGAPLPGVAVRITDVEREGRLLPPGSQGLIWLKGANVFNRYLGAEQSSLRAGWHCTGDIGWMDESGLLFVSGRKMRFSTIGGEIVPHEKLERVLAQLFRVDNTEGALKLAVVGVPDAREGESLILLSTIHKNPAEYQATATRNNLRNAGYPGQWTPKKLIHVDFIPMLPDGKLNYPYCYRGVCQQLNIPLPGQEA